MGFGRGESMGRGWGLVCTHGRAGLAVWCKGGLRVGLCILVRCVCGLCLVWMYFREF